MDKQLKVLHLEDSSTDAWLIERSLKGSGLNFTIQIVDNREDFIQALDQLNPDLILSDHSLPQFDSMEALKIYREKKINIPFILITGSVSEEFAIQSIKEGADDYILKNNLIRLPSAIKQSLKARQIAQEKQEAHVELEVKNKELNTFIYKATHELRGPLCSIMGLTNIAGMESEKNDLPGYIEKISESTKKLDAVLLSLIEVMNIKDSQPVLKEIDFKPLVDDILRKFRFLENSLGIEFKFENTIKKGFFSDENILASVLQNVIENAIKYRNVSSYSSFVSIGIHNSGDGIKIDIEDNGIGIDADIQDQIFDMYFRGTQYSKGSGLGLYIALNGVKKLGGNISVTSEIDKGSLFTINLPGSLILM